MTRASLRLLLGVALLAGLTVVTLACFVVISAFGSQEKGQPDAISLSGLSQLLGIPRSPSLSEKTFQDAVREAVRAELQGISGNKSSRQALLRPQADADKESRPELRLPVQAPPPPPNSPNAWEAWLPPPAAGTEQHAPAQQPSEDALQEAGPGLGPSRWELWQTEREREWEKQKHRSEAHRRKRGTGAGSPSPASQQQVAAKPPSSGFHDVAPISLAGCQLPFDTDGGGAGHGAAEALGKPPRLTVEMMQRSSESGVAIVSFTNILTLDMALNWALHLRLAGVAPGPLVGLMEDVDEEGYARLAPHVMAFAAHSQSSTRHEMDAQGGRWALARAVMQVAVDAGVSLLISDNDVAWLRNPVPYLTAIQAKYPGLDFLISSDAPTSTALDFNRNNFIETSEGRALGLEDSLINHAPFNIGILWFASRQASVDVLQRFVDTVATINEVDQWPINLMLRVGLMERVAGSRPKVPNRATYPVADGAFNMGVFNVYQFSSALVYSVTQAWREQGLVPYAVHFTYVQNQNLRSKVLRAREELLWGDPPAYYTSEKLITYDVEIPPAMLVLRETERGAPPQHHFELLNLQLRHFQAALLVGRSLGRYVVMPRFRCTCQNEGIVPHENCRGPGHPTKLPYLCPTDHVFVPWELEKLGVKPPGFGDHPCMPPEFMQNKVNILVCGIQMPCPREAKPPLLRAKSNSLQIAEQLGRYADINVLHFTNIADAYGGFADTDGQRPEFFEIANRSLYKFFTYDPPPNGVPTDPLGDVHIVEFRWPFSWKSQDIATQSDAYL